ncbi:hypothetical protein Aeqsu_2325 [Aequorivita sublithincola DSM 14238]|uniref:Secretion system C-terminal sorting domain-containing protein n=1 Tax=Aequorivita sublithincola (strain DSM 14238 / LMG 21431 / ACAM 643 / 9-3) TaxID=746697 RepID=I3YXR7_AEQSU|nr:T9SS type A sorting domain-containing protein [Aequorivita sublithincola]AFL81785.1 hypothetical protein Aeqsu_2325 [Aequorivita sublithincola DSM 14238]
MKTYTFPFVFCALLTLSMSGQQAAKKSTPVISSGMLSPNPTITPSSLVTCDGVLSNYTNAIPNNLRGVTSQDFEETYDAYDNMAADDFEARGTGESTICEVSIMGFFDKIGFSGDPDSEIVLRLFENDGGLPGTLIYTENFSGTVDDNYDGDFILELTGGPALTGGTKYWLSVQAVLNVIKAGQWYWDTATDGNGEIYAWQNPLDGFGGGCIVWSPYTNCGLTSEGLDLIMDISFNEALSINSNSLETAVTLYPNPAKNQFILQSNVSLKKLTIYDIRGRMMSNIDLSEMPQEKTIDISSLTSGVYFVRITDDKNSVVKKLLKQ